MFTIPTAHYSESIPPSSFKFQVKTDNTGTSSDTEFVIPLTTGPNSFNVDLGNGDQLLGVTQTTPLTLDYSGTGAGTYEVTITGTIKGFRFNNLNDKSKLLNISEFGPLQFTNDGDAFYGCDNLTLTPTDTPNLTGVTDMTNWFRLTTFASITNFNTWDFSNIDTASRMLSGNSFFNEVFPPLPALVDGFEMLFACSAYNQAFPSLPLLSDGRGMLLACVAYNQVFPALPSLTLAFRMLQGATSYNQVFPALPLLADAQRMLRSANSYNQDFPALPSLTNASELLILATSFNSVFTSLPAVVNATSMLQSTPYNQVLPPMPLISLANNMLLSAIAFDQSLAAMDISNLTTGVNFLLGAGISTANYDATLIAWAALPLQSGVSIHMGSSQYTLGGAAEAARTSIITTYSWTIVDGGGI